MCASSPHQTHVIVALSLESQDKIDQVRKKKGWHRIIVFVDLAKKKNQLIFLWVRLTEVILLLSMTKRSERARKAVSGSHFDR